MKTSKFCKGKLVVSINQLCRLIDNNEWVYLIDRPKHPTIIANMTLRTVRGFLNHKMLWKAIKNENSNSNTSL